jgi:hypothetical protein
MRLVLPVLCALAIIALVPAAEGHPIEGDPSCRGPALIVGLWVQEWARDPIDEDGKGLHKFNSAGCFDNRIQ